MPAIAAASIWGLTGFLTKLNAQSAMFVLNYDGRKGAKTYGRTLPEELNLVHLVIEAGRSTQSTLLGRRDITYESLYLSPALIERIESAAEKIENFAKWKSSSTQLELLLV